METGETVQDESDNREREYWTQISESEAPDAIVDAIQFLPENYTMQIDDDVPVNATSSVETSLAYGLNAHNASLAKSTVAAWNPKKKSFAASIHISLTYIAISTTYSSSTCFF